MVDIKKPNKKKSLGTPPTPEESSVNSDNLAKPEPDQLVPMNFKVPSEFRKQYRILAGTHDVSMTDILKESFELYRRQKGG